MSIAAYDLFTDFGSEMVYVPINRNEFITPFPKRRPKSPALLKDRLSVVEYFKAYGFSVTNRDRLDDYHERAKAQQDTTAFIFDHYVDVRPLLQWLRSQMPSDKKKLKRGCDFSGEFATCNQYQQELIKRLAFEHKGSAISKKISQPEWEYLRGGWLEEYLYRSIRDAVPPGAHVDIGMNIRCEDPQKVQNEFDVVFCYENALYLVECKSLGAIEGNEQHMGGTIRDFLYKMGALRQNFGLTPRAFLATTSEEVLAHNGDLKPDLAKRAGQFSTEILPLLKNRDVKAYFREKVFK